MSSRLVLRIERDGRVLGSWSVSEAPLELKLVDLATGQVTVCFTATSGAPGALDEVPVTAASMDLARLGGDDFTMPLPERSQSLAGGLRQPAPQAVPNLANSSPDGLTAELEELDLDEDRLGETYVGEETAKLRRPPVDELPLAQRPTASGVALDRDSVPGLTAELRTATVSDPGATPQAVLRPSGHTDAVPSPAEVWVQRSGEWRSVGTLVAGQRVRTLGGWVRLAPDGHLVVSAGDRLAGTATLLDGRLVDIAAGHAFVSLPAGSSVTLAVGDRGVYVRSEPLVGRAVDAQ